MSSQTFAIVGLGLLGGSLGGALRKKFPRAQILGYSRSSSKIKLAQKKKFIHSGSIHLNQVVQTSDIIFVCTPVDTIPHMVREIDSFARKGTVVCDVGSTKAQMIQKIQRLKLKNISFVGAHPMAGSHLTGLSHATSDLYKSSLTFITVHSGINQNALKKIAQVWRKLGSKVITVNPSTHDEIVAEISHFPHLLSALLVNTVSPKTLTFAGPGFRDTTRIAQGDPRLWVPILSDNQKNLIRLLKKLNVSLNKTLTALQSKDQNFLKKLLKKAALKRSKLA